MRHDCEDAWNCERVRFAGLTHENKEDGQKWPFCEPARNSFFWRDISHIQIDDPSLKTKATLFLRTLEYSTIFFETMAEGFSVVEQGTKLT